jgi:tetratricopeptide (TPR) repeat protein
MDLLKNGQYCGEAALSSLPGLPIGWPKSPRPGLFRVRVSESSMRTLADFDEAVDVNPNWAEAYSARGEIYRDKGDLKRAVQEFTNSIQHKPTLHAYLSRGQVYEALGQHREAIEDYDKATELSDSPYIYVVRALAKRNLGDIAGSDADRAKARSVARRHQVAEPQAKSEER